MSELSRGDALRQGIAPAIEQVAAVVQAEFTDGPARGTRFIDVHPAEGLGFRVLPDRGFDIAHAWHRGEQLAWLSKVGAAPPVAGLAGMEWLDHYGGGLVVTCGLDNAGIPSDDVCLHGTFSHLRSHDVTIRREIVGSEVAIELSAQITDATALGRHLTIERTIRTGTGQAWVEIRDLVTNRGRHAEPTPLLYHCNVGYPLWQPGASMAVDHDGVRAREPVGEASAADGTWAAAPSVDQLDVELVFEHLDPRGRAEIQSPPSGRRLRIEWDVVELPRLFHWIHPVGGVYALGVEPANVTLEGRAANRAAGTLPLLEPGATQSTGVRLSVDDIDAG